MILRILSAKMVTALLCLGSQYWKERYKIIRVWRNSNGICEHREESQGCMLELEYRIRSPTLKLGSKRCNCKTETWIGEKGERIEHKCPLVARER